MIDDRGVHRAHVGVPIDSARPSTATGRSRRLLVVDARKVPTTFAVAFALAGSRRELVLPVAREVEAELGRSAVFYDTWYEDWIASRDVDSLLGHLYHERSELIVVCIAATYSHSAWAVSERRALCARILSLPPSAHRSILPLRVGDGEPPGMAITGDVSDARGLTVRHSAELIVGRLGVLREPSAGRQETRGAISVLSVAQDPPPQPATGAIFISYRRSDTAAFAGRLYDRLTARFGRDQVFMDVDSIEPGVDFVDTIDRTLGRCTVFIAVIGADWLTAVDPLGARRLDDPGDFVRLEIEHALARTVRVIPVLVDGAQMPQRLDLPESMGPLTRRNAHAMSNSRFGLDVGELLVALERVLV